MLLLLSADFNLKQIFQEPLQRQNRCQQIASAADLQATQNAFYLRKCLNSLSARELGHEQHMQQNNHRGQPAP